MPRCRVVVPRTKRLDLSDGDFVEVVEELSAGEYSDMLKAMVERKPFAKILAYVVRWSFLGADDQPLPYSVGMDEDERRATVRSLDKATMRELQSAVDKHEAAEEAELEKKRQTTATPPASSVTSTSAR